MNQQQIEMVKQACIKAACTGLVQSLVNRGYDQEVAAKAAVLYAHPESGMLTKRAHNREVIREKVAQAVLTMRGHL